MHRVIARTAIVEEKSFKRNCLANGIVFFGGEKNICKVNAGNFGRKHKKFDEREHNDFF